MLEISQWPDTKVFSLSVICRSATSETKSPFPPSQKMSYLQTAAPLFFFSEPLQIPGQKCQHCHSFCSCAAISLKCAISMHIYAGLSEISIPRAAEAWGDQVCLLSFKVRWKIRNRKERLVRQKNNKMFLHFSHPSFFPTWQGLVKSRIFFVGSECSITCASLCCFQKKMLMIFDIWAHRVNRFRSLQCSLEETICCDSSEQGRLCLCYVLCSLHFSVSANEGILAGTPWTHFL